MCTVQSFSILAKKSPSNRGRAESISEETWRRRIKYKPLTLLAQCRRAILSHQRDRLKPACGPFVGTPRLPGSGRAVRSLRRRPTAGPGAVVHRRSGHDDYDEQARVTLIQSTFARVPATVESCRDGGFRDDELLVRGRALACLGDKARQDQGSVRYARCRRRRASLRAQGVSAARSRRR